jgi:hypothetical protein
VLVLDGVGVDAAGVPEEPVVAPVSVEVVAGSVANQTFAMFCPLVWPAAESPA